MVLFRVNIVSFLLAMPFLTAAQDNHIRLGIGHQNSLADFDYTVKADSLTQVETMIYHEGQWGLKTLSTTEAKLAVEHVYRPQHIVYATADAKHTYYSRYGCYFVDSTESYSINRISDMQHWDDTQHQWEAETHLGFKSGNQSPVTYMTQVDYYALVLPEVTTEHQARVRANACWQKDAHTVGCNLMWQSDWYVLAHEYMPRDWYNSRHNFRSEPYYEYNAERFFVHAGVHLDANFGRNNSPTLHTSQKTDLGVFCPSPNINIRACVVPNQLDIRLDVTGRAGWGSLQNYMKGNRYYEIIPGVKSHHVPTYIPVNVELTLDWTPVENLSIDLKGGYMYSIGDGVFEGYSYAWDYKSVYPWLVRPGYFNNYCIDIDRWRVGAELRYEYRDKLRLYASGEYYFWHMYQFEDADPYNQVSGDFSSTYTPGMIYDRPNWEARLEIDWKPMRSWTVYSHNYFRGKMMAWIQSEDKPLRETVDLNVGTKVQVKDNIYVFAELRNILNRKHYNWYGYQLQGMNCLIGVTVNLLS